MDSTAIPAGMTVTARHFDVEQWRGMVGVPLELDGWPLIWPSYPPMDAARRTACRADSKGHEARMAPPTDDFLSVQDAARILGVSPRTLLRWIREGRIPHRVSETGEPQLPREDVIRLMEPPAPGRPADDE